MFIPPQTLILFIYLFLPFYFPLNQVLISAGVENWGTQEINESHGTKIICVVDFFFLF